jgi:hypothetical protein
LQPLYFLQRLQSFTPRLAVVAASVAEEPQSISMAPPLQVQRAIVSGAFAYKISAQRYGRFAPRGGQGGMSIALLFA